MDTGVLSRNSGCQKETDIEDRHGRRVLLREEEAVVVMKW